MSQLTRADVCARYGLADRELVDFLESPAGLTFTTADGITLIDVPADTPDAVGKTGLMYLNPPQVELGYQGGFPIFANPEDETPAADAENGGDAGNGEVDLASMTKAQLVVLAAAAFGAELSIKSTHAVLLEEVTALQADADAKAAADAENGGDGS